MTGAQELGLLQLSWGSFNQRELDWLKAKGVSALTISRPWPISATNVSFGRTSFGPAPGGTRVITLPVIDGGEVVDIAAWQPKSGRLVLYHGHAFCLGVDEIHNPATFLHGGALHVHESPLEWLQEDRTGIVIANPDQTNCYLANCPQLSFDNEVTAARVRRWIEPPKPTAKLFFRQQMQEAA